MKKIIATLLATTAFVFAEEPSLTVSTTTTPVSGELKLPVSPVPETKISPKQGFFYVRFMTAENDIARPSSILPGLGIGYRRLAGDGAADISFNGIGRSEHRKASRYVWTAPKASYFHYLQPNSEQSLYVGGGLAWGGVETKENRTEYYYDYDKNLFIGIIPSATVGYEFVHKGSVLGFTEFSLSQPAIALFDHGSLPGPIAELSLGVGF